MKIDRTSKRKMCSHTLRCVVLILTGCISFTNVFSQCTYAIPSDAHVFSSSNTLIQTGADNLLILGTNWICAGDTITITSGFGSQTFFLENNAVLKGGGGGSRTVYLKPGALFDAGGGGSQVIFYDDGTSYINCGSVYPTYCAPLTFDYTNAPANGCIATVVSDENVSVAGIKLFPDPADEELTVSFSEIKHSPVRLLIFNSEGEKFFEEEVNQFPVTINTSLLPEGFYFVSLNIDNSFFNKRKFIIAH